MPKGILIKIFFLILLCVPALTRAQVINEIFYSPAAKSWIEIYNNTDSEIDLSQFKILDSGASVNGHAISASETGGSTVLSPGEYGVVAKDPTSVNAVHLYKSSLGIKTTGDTVSLKKGTSVVDKVEFSDNAAEGGKSYQKLDSWVAATPTPGSPNTLVTEENATSTATSTEVTSTTTEQVSNALYSAHYSYVTVQNDTSVKFSVSAGRDRVTTTGQDVVFKAIPNTKDPNISYIWNFGDGSVAEGEEVIHIYTLPGDYNVVLEAKFFENEAISRAKVKVTNREVVLSEVNSDYIAIENKGKYEVNLYGLSVKNDSVSFSFPKDTIISAGSSVKFSSSVTKITDPMNVVLVWGTTTVSSLSSTVSTEEIDPEKAKEIQALADKIIVLQKELAWRKNPSKTVASVNSEIENTSSSPLGNQTASAALSLSASSTDSQGHSWISVLKKFFLK